MRREKRGWDGAPYRESLTVLQQSASAGQKQALPQDL